MAGGGEDAFGEGVHLDGEARGHGGEDRSVDADARLLHAQQDGDEREVHGAVEVEKRRSIPGLKFQTWGTQCCGGTSSGGVALGHLLGEDAGQADDGGGGFGETIGVGKDCLGRLMN